MYNTCTKESSLYVHVYLPYTQCTYIYISFTTGSTEGTFDEDKKNSPIPSYVNVELDNESIPMTTSPGYMQVERMTEGPKPLYGNL